jgi:hypothetical protein
MAACGAKRTVNLHLRQYLSAGDDYPGCRKQNNIPLLEIDLSKFDRQSHEEWLTDILNGNTTYMEWIYNPKIKERYEIAEKKAQIVREFIHKHFAEHKIYGAKDQFIYDCPVHTKYQKVNVNILCHQCRLFLGEYEGVYQLGDERPKYPDYTLHCVGHVGPEFDALVKSLEIW